MSSVITLLRVLRIRNGNFNLASTVDQQFEVHHMVKVPVYYTNWLIDIY